MTTAKDTPQIQALRQRADQAALALEKAQDALTETQRQVEAAQSARQTRRQTLNTYEASALSAAKEDLTIGRGRVGSKERAADDQAERLRRELARADTILDELRQDQDAATQQVQAASQMLEQAQIALEEALSSAEVERLHAQVLALVEDLRRTCAEGRAHNQGVTSLMQRKAQAMGRGGISDSSARAAGATVLFLPGQIVPNPAIQRDNASIAQAGFTVQFTRDLQFPETDEWTALQRPL